MIFRKKYLHIFRKGLHYNIQNMCYLLKNFVLQTFNFTVFVQNNGNFSDIIIAVCQLRIKTAEFYYTQQNPSRWPHLFRCSV